MRAYRSCDSDIICLAFLQLYLDNLWPFHHHMTPHGHSPDFISSLMWIVLSLHPLQPNPDSLIIVFSMNLTQKFLVIPPLMIRVKGWRTKGAALGETGRKQNPLSPRKNRQSVFLRDSHKPGLSHLTPGYFGLSHGSVLFYCFHVYMTTYPPKTSFPI